MGPVKMFTRIFAVNAMTIQCSILFSLAHSKTKHLLHKACMCVLAHQMHSGTELAPALTPFTH